MATVTRQLVAGSSKFETGAVTGLLERRKLCLRSTNLPKAPAARPSRAGDDFVHTLVVRETVQAESWW